MQMAKFENGGSFSTLYYEWYTKRGATPPATPLDRGSNRTGTSRPLSSESVHSTSSKDMAPDGWLVLNGTQASTDL